MFNRLHLAAALPLLATVGHAQTYYSIDVANDLLCIVDVDSGLVTAMGPLVSCGQSADLEAVDLAWHQGALYAKTFGPPTGNKICQIVTDGHWIGAILEGNFLNGGGYQGGEVAGLASDGSFLYLTYSFGPPGDFNSLRFGSVQPAWSGNITFLGNLTRDIDAMGFTGGQFWGIDIDTAQNYHLVRGGALPNINVGTGTLNPPTSPVDVEHYSATELVGISLDGQHVVRISRATGARTFVTPVTGLAAGGDLNGIALRPACFRLRQF